MYERMVDVPRLIARVPDDGQGHPLVGAMAGALSRRYGVDFDSIMVALYRGGADSVAWHRDREVRELDESYVCVVSLGGLRRFMLRPFGGGPSTTLSVGWGDLVVMGGTCQRTFEHCVPKQKRADPRIALMFRHAYGG
jgi:alkylated DNA repair dioxygenase AlkB